MPITRGWASRSRVKSGSGRISPLRRDAGDVAKAGSADTPATPAAPRRNWRLEKRELTSRSTQRRRQVVRLDQRVNEGRTGRGLGFGERSLEVRSGVDRPRGLKTHRL